MSFTVSGAFDGTLKAIEFDVGISNITVNIAFS